MAGYWLWGDYGPWRSVWSNGVFCYYLSDHPSGASSNVGAYLSVMGVVVFVGVDGLQVHFTVLYTIIPCIHVLVMGRILVVIGWIGGKSVRHAAV